MEKDRNRRPPKFFIKHSPITNFQSQPPQHPLLHDKTYEYHRKINGRFRPPYGEVSEQERQNQHGRDKEDELTQKDNHSGFFSIADRLEKGKRHNHNSV